MAIAPVSSVSFRGNYNQVNFEGKKREKSSGLHVSNSIKAIPLATLIAMSPLNVVEAQSTSASNPDTRSTLIERKNYDGVLRTDMREGVNLTAEFYDRDGVSSTTEVVNMISSGTENKIFADEPLDRYDINAPIENLTDYSFNIVGDDGNSLGTLTYSQLNLKGGKAISVSNVVSDMREFANSSENNAFQIKKVNVNLIPKRGVGLRTFIEGTTEFGTSWIQKVNNVPYNFGDVVNTAKFSTQAGEYNIDFYSSDGNPRNYETVVVRRDDGLKFKLDGLTQLDLTFATNDGNKDEKVSIPLIDVSWPKVGQYSIFDNELFNALYTLSQEDDFNKAFKISIFDRKVSVNKFGGLATVESNENILK